VPEELRASLLRNLSADEDNAEDQRKARVAREQGEITRLRSESRRLRSEHAAMESRVGSLEKEVTRWAWVATGTSAVSIVLIMLSVFFGPSGAAPADVAPAAPGGEAALAAAATPGAAAAPGAADPASPRNGTVAEQAGAALMAAGVMEGAQLEVIVRGTTAQLSGYAPTWAQLKKAAKVVDEVQGVDKVGTDGVIVLAKRDGTTHTVKPGEVLGKIASDYYGKASLHTKILEANPELAGGANLRVGMTIKIPPVRDEPAPAATP
jgi:nucleoid-associated protein YgaU